MTAPEMERDLLSDEDWKMILDSLEFTRLKFEGYDYPSNEYKQKRVDEVNELILKIKRLLRS